MDSLRKVDMASISLHMIIFQSVQVCVYFRWQRVSLRFPRPRTRKCSSLIFFLSLSAFDAHRSRHTQTARPATVQRLQKRFSMKKRFYCRKKFSRVTPSFFDSLRYSSSAIQQRNDLFAVRIDRAWILSFGSILHLKGNVIPSLSVDLL